MNAITDVLTVLRGADAHDKAELYGQLGLKLTYNRGAKTVTAQAGRLVKAAGNAGEFAIGSAPPIRLSGTDSNNVSRPGGPEPSSSQRLFHRNDLQRFLHLGAQRAHGVAARTSLMACRA